MLIMGGVGLGSRRGRLREVAALAAGCAVLAVLLPPGGGAAGGAGGARRAANAEVMIVTRGALEGGLSPSG
jgi:hypothetical protein